MNYKEVILYYDILNYYVVNKVYYIRGESECHGIVSLFLTYSSQVIRVSITLKTDGLTNISLYCYYNFDNDFVFQLYGLLVPLWILTQWKHRIATPCNFYSMMASQGLIIFNAYYGLFGGKAKRA